jgi:tetratricopeptide (TPR) repeat protein
MKKGSVWSVKNPENGSIRTVVVVSKEKQLHEKVYYRVRPISDQIQFAADNDLLIKDNSVTGYPFLVESWNEQPVNKELLQEKLGFIDPEILDSKREVKVSLTEDQKQFRAREIELASFIRNSIYSELQEVFFWADENEGKVIPLFSSAVMRIAASFIILAVAVFLIWQPHKMSNEEILDQYAHHVPADLKVQYGEAVRGEGCSFENLTSSECRIIEKALDDYNNKNYKEALAAFEQILEPRRKNYNLVFYLAASHFYTGNYAQAEQELWPLSELKNYRYKNDVDYLLALTYLEQDKKSKAKKLLKSLKENNNRYSEEASEILKQIRWF